MPYIGSSRYKYSPYLTMNFGKTEKFIAGDAVEPWQPPDQTNYRYDEYMEYLGIDYWWKMQGLYNSVGDNEPNVGTAGPMPLYARESTSLLLSQQNRITLNTRDNYSAIKGLAVNSHTANVLIDGTSSFTVGGWFLINSYSSNTGIIKTNAGNNTYSSGLHVRVKGSSVGGYIEITAFRGTVGTNKKWTSPLTSFALDYIHFLVLKVQPSASTSGLILELYVDGEQILLTPDATADHTIDWNTTVGTEEKGISFSSTDSQSNGSALGNYDEIFLHFGLLQKADIQELYSRGLDYLGDTRLLLHFDGNEGDTTTVDSSPYSNPVVLVGMTLATSSPKFGSACLYSAPQSNSQCYVSHTPYINIGLLEEWTIDLWIKLDSISGLRSISSKRFNSLSYGTWFWAINGGTMQIYLSNSAGTAWSYQDLTCGTLTINNWTHVALEVYGGVARTYLNGVVSGSATITGPLHANAEPIRFGGEGTANRLAGNMDEIRISSKAMYKGITFTPNISPY